MSINFYSRLFSSLTIGISSGMVLGFLLKWIQSAWNVPVYNLLLNVDYIPWINTFDFSEWFEFTLHLIISVLLTYVLLHVTSAIHLYGRRLLSTCIIVCIVIGLMLYPSTLLSVHTLTPSISDIGAWLWWTMAHALYGFVLGVLLNIQQRKK